MDTDDICDCEDQDPCDRLADRLEKIMKEKQKKCEIEKRKKHPWGVPPGPFPEEVGKLWERAEGKGHRESKERRRTFDWSAIWRRKSTHLW
jgi:hypothetical protein